jgi:hypothetical protein
VKSLRTRFAQAFAEECRGGGDANLIRQNTPQINQSSLSTSATPTASLAQLTSFLMD